MTIFFKLNNKKESWLLINDDKIRMFDGDLKKKKSLQLIMFLKILSFQVQG